VRGHQRRLLGSSESGSGGGATYGGFGSTFVNVKDAPYSAAGDNSTDDTAAIQAAIDAVTAEGGGTVYFPEGRYLVSGALKSSHNAGTRLYRAQVTIPEVSMNSKKVELELLGPTPMGDYAGYTTGTVVPDQGAIIVSTLTGQTYSAAGLPACIGGPDEVDGTGFNRTNVGVYVRNLGFRAPSNPTVTMVNLARVASAKVQACFFDTTVGLANVVQPTAGTGRGLRMPSVANNTLLRVQDVAIVGYMVGLETGEHCLTENVEIIMCIVPWTPMPGPHLQWAVNVGIEWCPYLIASVNPSTGIVGDLTSAAYLDIDGLSIEEHTGSPTWMNPATNVILDNSHHLRGHVRFARSAAGGVPATDGLPTQGARRLSLSNVASGKFNVHSKTLASFTAINNGTSGKIIEVGAGTGAPYVAFDSTADLAFFTQTRAKLLADNALDGTETTVARITKDGAVRPRQLATGSRPAAATAGAGAMIWDSTLGKPIWSTGSAWVDATGAAV